MEFLYEKLREERKSRKMTIKQLSELSNVSGGMVSSIERGLVNPSVDVLFRICNALHLEVDYFLPVKNGRNELSIIKREDQYRIMNRASTTYFASPLLEKSGHSVLVIFVKPGAEYGRRHISHEHNELIVVIDGKILLHYGGEDHLLETGDSAYFSAGQKHYVNNPSDTTTTLVWCIFKVR